MSLSPRIAVTAIFVLSGAVYGSWAARIPAVKVSLGLGDGDLAVALWAFASGAVVVMPVVTALLRRHGERTVCRVAAPCFAAALALPALAGSRGALVAALAVMGACNGALDVAMNAAGVGLQRTRVRPLVQSLHGGYGVGLASGGMLGAGAAAIGVPARWHLLVAAAALLGIATAVTSQLPDAVARAGAPGRHVTGRRVARSLAPVLVFATFAAFVEVSLTEWSGVFTQQELRGSPTAAAAAFATFAIAMTVGRLVGDAPLQRLGPRAIRLGAAATSAALLTALAAGRPGLFLAALAVSGLGIAWAFPAAIVAADEAAGEPGIALVSAAAYAAGLMGPPLLGLVAEASTLTVAFSLIAVAAAASATLSRSLGERT